MTTATAQLPAAGEVAPTSDGHCAEDPFRLRQCPWCDYSLETLPSQGICPECGGHYNQTYIVLTGPGRGRFDTIASGTWRSVIGMIACLAFAGWIFADLRAALHHPMALTFSIFSILAFAAVWAARLFSTRDSKIQLWLSPRGALQTHSSPEVRSVARVISFLWILYLPTMAAAMMLGGSAFLSVEVITVLILFCIPWINILWAAWRKRTRRRKAQSAPPRVTPPGFFPWNGIDSTRFDRLRTGSRVRVRLETSTRVFGLIKVSREPVADIELDLSSALSEALQERIAAWMSTSGPLKSTSPPVRQRE